MTNNSNNQCTFQVKTRHGHGSLPRNIVEQFERDDTPYRVQAYFAVASKQVREQSISKENRELFAANQERLSKNYHFDEAVVAFLKSNSSLFEILFEAVEEIYRYFGEEVNLYLQILKEGVSEKLFVLIHSNLELDSAMHNLNNFDREWWFQKSRDIHKYLEFSLEFN